MASTPEEKTTRKTRAQSDPSASVEQIEVRSPLTGAPVGTLDVATPEHLAAVVAKARYAQKLWAARTLDNRLHIMRRFQSLLWDRQAEIMRTIADETGKSKPSAYIEVVDIDLMISWLAGNARRVLRPERRKPLFPLVQYARVYHKPHGVVGLIEPWNYPLALPLMDLIPALLAGNAVILKPSELTPFTALHAVDLLHAAGVPTDIVQVVVGGAEVGAALVDAVDYLAFTGSTNAGRQVAVRAAGRLIPYSLELGGINAMIVLKDADIELAASGAVAGALENAGQMCVSIERVYVEEPLYAKFVERVAHYAASVKIGPEYRDDVDLGGLTSTREIERAEQHVADAVAQGARLVFGGKRRPDLGPTFFEPVVLADVNHDMQVMCEETFGPMIAIMPVRDLDEALRLANDSPYGLSGAVFTRDTRKGEHVALQLDTGDVAVNRTTALVIGSHSLPWGGVKHSGNGRRNGPEGLLRFTTTQSILVDRRWDQQASPVLTDPFSLMAINVLRRVRRVLPWI
ncbi:MAG TPA: succinic semialdehyde dehydrogenase [Aggregatilineales bacterium]|nr:succinic semialdehyde dehydrogenase [Aggregatilineales bacterium]